MAERIGYLEAKLAGRMHRFLPVALLLALIVLAFGLRLWDLNATPPGLWWDEAGQGLDAREVLEGNFRIFFPRSSGKEPLYVYLTVPFAALWDGQPIAVRLAGALMGALTVPALFLAGKALLPEDPRRGSWFGLIAAAFWTINYWPQSINRLGFRVNTLVPLLTLAVVAWLNWTHRPTRRRAVTFGILAGLTLTTYLAARITPFLWLILHFTLPSRKRRELRATLIWAFLALLLVAAPLLAHFALNPQDFIARMSSFDVVEGATTLGARISVWLNSATKVFGVFFGGEGDPIPRHNLAGRPPFAPYLAVLFGIGLVLALFHLRKREQWAWTLLLWWAVLAVPAVLAADANPHFLRLFGALPSALLLAAWPIAWLIQWSRSRSRYLGVTVVVLLMLFMGIDGAGTIQTYFVTWGQDPDLYTWYNGDTWLFGERVRETPDALGVIPLSPRLFPAQREYTLDYAFADIPLLQMRVDEEDIEEWLEEQLSDIREARIMVPIWHEGMHAHADPKGILEFYLAREGVLESREVLRGFDLLTFSLKADPQFTTVGSRDTVGQSFSNLDLVDARWGVGYPNPDSSGETAAAGTPVWAILTWQLKYPSPDLKVTLDLVDDAGHRLDSSEVPLLNAENLPTSQWPAGTIGRSYHMIMVPSTQPPGSVWLESRVYDANTLIAVQPDSGSLHGGVPIGRVSISPALQPQSDDVLSVARPVQARLPSGVTLIGLDPWPEEISPGQDLILRLYWQAEVPLHSTQFYTILLDGTDVSAAVRLPLNLPVGQPIHTYADLKLPPDVPTGSYHLVLDSHDGASSVKLGQISVAGRSREFEVPRLQTCLDVTFGDLVALLGMDVAGDLHVTPGQSMKVNLIWRVLDTPGLDLVRFTHLVGSDEQPLAQQDTVACSGTCPASAWLLGEILRDEVSMVIPDDLAPGSYSLVVGWYDAATASRLPAQDADGRRLQDDVFPLPLKVVVGP
jgi:hypothetical protein